MPTNLSKILSFIFHPLLIPTYLFLILFSLFPTLFRHEQLVWLFLGIIIILTFVVPVWSVLFLKHIGIISSIYLNEQKERTLPFMLTTLIYGGTYLFLLNLEIDVFNVLPKMMLLITSSILISTIITYFWKISVHAIGISGIIGVLTRIAFSVQSIELLIFLMIGLILSGFVMSARLSLNAHTPKQIYMGFLVGFLISFIASFWILV